MKCEVLLLALAISLLAVYAEEEKAFGHTLPVIPTSLEPQDKLPLLVKSYRIYKTVDGGTGQSTYETKELDENDVTRSSEGNTKQVPRLMWIAVRKADEELPGHVYDLLKRNEKWLPQICDNDCKDKFIDTVWKGTSIQWAYHSLNSEVAGAFKADIWRYAVLYTYGGMYIDDDSNMNTPFDDILHDDDSLVLSEEGPSSIGPCYKNDFQLNDKYFYLHNKAKLHDKSFDKDRVFFQGFADGDGDGDGAGDGSIDDSEEAQKSTSKFIIPSQNVKTKSPTFFHGNTLLNWCMFIRPRHPMMKRLMENVVTIIRNEYLHRSVLHVARWEQKYKIPLCSTNFVMTYTIREMLTEGDFGDLFKWTGERNKESAYALLPRILVRDFKDYGGKCKAIWTGADQSHYTKKWKKHPMLLSSYTEHGPSLEEKLKNIANKPVMCFEGKDKGIYYVTNNTNTNTNTKDSTDTGTSMSGGEKEKEGDKDANAVFDKYRKHIFTDFDSFTDYGYDMADVTHVHYKLIELMQQGEGILSKDKLKENLNKSTRNRNRNRNRALSSSSGDEISINTNTAKRLKLCFYSNDASGRGTSQALYDYAINTAKYLDMDPKIIFPKVIETSNPLSDGYETTFDIRGNIEAGNSVFSGNDHGCRLSLPKFINTFGAENVSFCGESYSQKLFDHAKQMYRPGEHKIISYCPDIARFAKLDVGCDMLYIIKGGQKKSTPIYPDAFQFQLERKGKDSNSSSNSKGGKDTDVNVEVEVGSLPTLVHSVFNWEPHGTVYAAISSAIKWYDRKNSGNIVPHIVNPPLDSDLQGQDLRESLDIKKTALVVCRHGGNTTFDIPYAQKAILLLLSKHSDDKLHFVFMGTDLLKLRLEHYAKDMSILYTDPSILPAARQGLPDKNSSTLIYSENEMMSKIRKQVHFMPSSTKSSDKETFFRTCDTMLHARRDGETFGLAVAEFSVRNKPVITKGASKRYAGEHVRILGEKGFYFEDQKDLIKIIDNFVIKGVDKEKDYNAHRDFTAEKVMAKFKELFIDIAKPLVLMKNPDEKETIW